jgi:hypothetical protein
MAELNVPTIAWLSILVRPEQGRLTESKARSRLKTGEAKDTPAFVAGAAGWLSSWVFSMFDGFGDACVSYEEDWGQDETKTTFMRLVKGHFIVSGPDVELMKFKSRAEARDWCRTHHPGSPITEVGPGGKECQRETAAKALKRSPTAERMLSPCIVRTAGRPPPEQLDPSPRFAWAFCLARTNHTPDRGFVKSTM